MAEALADSELEDAVMSNLRDVARWIGDCDRALKRGRAGLSVVH